jgi:hypothetical protein
MNKETKQLILDDFNDRFYMELESYEDIELFLGDESSENILPIERKAFFDYWSPEMAEGMEQKIINAMVEHCKRDFMQYTGFDEKLEHGLAEAITVFIAEAMPDEDESSIYDFIKSKLK